MGAWAGLRVVSFITLRRFLASFVGRTNPAPRAVAFARIGWAVEAVARRLPVTMTCLPKALAADAMLRRRGFTSQLHLGARQPRVGSGGFESHAWVECEGRVVVGDLDDLSDYVPLASTSHS